jgi:hypothetical protein
VGDDPTARACWSKKDSETVRERLQKKSFRPILAHSFRSLIISCLVISFFDFKAVKLSVSDAMRYLAFQQ